MKNRIIGCVLFFLTAINILTIVLGMNIVPLQLRLETFKFEYGDNCVSTNVSDYVIANDNVIEQAQLNLSNVKNAVGVYEASVTYMDKEYPFHIKIVDTTKPVAELKQVQFNIAVGQTLDAIDLLKFVEDNSDVVAYFESENEEPVTSKTFNKKGSYIERLVVIDSSDNQSAKLRAKIVVGEEGEMPTISGINEIEITKGKTFDPLKGVSATDGKGNDITSKIEIISNTVNIKEEGIYEVIYKVINDNGNMIQRSRKVVVIE